MTLGDPLSVTPIGRDIYAETAPGSNAREYVLAPESTVFPYTYDIPAGSRSVSTICFNVDGSLIATVDQGLPNIVWMWSIEKIAPKLIGALVQKSNIRQLLWQKSHEPELLMTTNDDDLPTFHQWICGQVPRIGKVSNATGGKYMTSWIQGYENRRVLFFGWQTGFAIGSVKETGSDSELTPFSRLGEDSLLLVDDDVDTNG